MNNQKTEVKKGKRRIILDIFLAVLHVAFLGVAVYNILIYTDLAFRTQSFMVTGDSYKLNAFIAVGMIAVVACSWLWIKKEYSYFKIIAAGVVAAAIVAVAVCLLNNFCHWAAYNGYFGIREWALYPGFLADDIRYSFTHSNMRYSAVFLMTAWCSILVPAMLKFIDPVNSDWKLIKIEYEDEKTDDDNLSEKNDEMLFEIGTLNLDGYKFRYTGKKLLEYTDKYFIMDGKKYTEDFFLKTMEADLDDGAMRRYLDENGRTVIRIFEGVPTFDSGDRMYDSYRMLLIFEEKGKTEGIYLHGGYNLADAVRYRGIASADEITAEKIYRLKAAKAEE